MDAHQEPMRRQQQGAATLLFLLIAALAMLAATATALYGVGGSQKVQYTEHVATQADMAAWTGVSVLANAVKALPATAVLTANQAVQFAGLQAGITATYMGKSGTNLLFQVTGTSAGANATLLVAISPATTGGSTGTPLTTTVILKGPTAISGSVNFTGSTKLNLSVVGGDLTLNGSVTGLGTVCTTGNLTISAAINVDTACANGNVTLAGAATVNSINAGGNVLLQGGASGAIGTINANGYVNLSGGSASAGTINAGSYVLVSGGGANVGIVNSLSTINWTSSNAATALNANGDITYSTSASNAGTTTSINTQGKVSLSAAKTVNALGNVTLSGYYGQGVSGTLNSGGTLSGSSWGAGGGAVAAAGTVASIVSPYPATVKVTVLAGYRPTIPSVALTPVPIFSAAPITIDVYPLATSSNYVFTGVDSSGNPKVSVANVNGVTNGNYVIANYGGKNNYLCASATGSNCTGTPLMKICQGYSDSNTCFSYTSSTGTWGLVGTQLQPGVFWFQGNVSIGTGNWVATFLASGNATTSGAVAIFSPNYEAAAVTCAGAADTTNSIVALSSFTGMSGSFYPKQLCTSASVSAANAVGNVAIIAGGYAGGVFAGGTITLGASTKAYGSVLAGQYLNTGGSTTLNGPIYSAGQGSTGSGNSLSNSTNISFSGGSSTYTPGTPPCMASSCLSTGTTGNNIVWVGPM